MAQLFPLDTLSLKKWFIKNKRSFPWRKNCSPYAVWVSEIMLQQTKAAVVIPYFLKWMDHFPTIESLAKANLETVIKLWEGLGYYSRARNLHAGAKLVMEKFAGKLPPLEKELRQMKGLGPYTTSAILSFAFHQKKAAVDGNVLRVFSRYYQIKDDISKSQTHKKITEILQAQLPEQEPWVINEALIELGATVCRPVPNCSVCPLASSCLSFQHHTTQQFPYKSKKVAVTRQFRAVALLSYDNQFFAIKGAPGKVMADLYEFPSIEISDSSKELDTLCKFLKETYQLTPIFKCILKSVCHSYTRYKDSLTPYLFSLDQLGATDKGQWRSLQELKSLPFSSGHRQILDQLMQL